MGSDGIIFEKDISEILRIQRVYEEKRRRIDMKVARGTKTYKSLMRKYGRKEANKVKDLLHKLSKEVAEMCKGYVIVFEDLKGLRKSINKKIKRYNKFTRKVQECSMYSKKLKRTWNKLPYQQIQRYVEYKHLLNGYETKYVNRKNTSRVCSRCGSTIKSWNKTCPRCNMDRDINACINLLRKFAEGEDKK